MKSVIFLFVLFVNVLCNPHAKQLNENDWIGHYSFSSENKDGLITSFDINIIKLDDITVIYVSDGEKPKTFKKLKSRLIQKNKIEINFNPQYKEMGIIYIEKKDEEYFISGSPIYFINPGNNEMPLKKIK